MIGRRTDLPLQRDSSNRFLPWMIAFMVYLAILALAAAMLFGTAVSRWSAGLAGTMTVQVPAGDDAEARIEKTVAVLKATPGVGSVRVLTAEESLALIEPWLGAGAKVADLPVPRLIDVRLDAGASLDTGALGERIAAVAPDVVVDDHRRWLADLIALASSVEWISAAIVALTAGSAVLTVVFAARTGLAVHHHVIELLHLIGARDSYVARQFQRHALWLGLKGGALGLVLALATLLSLHELLRRMDLPLLPALVLSPVQWTVLAAPAVVAAFISMYTARVTVLRVLARMP